MTKNGNRRSSVVGLRTKGGGWDLISPCLTAWSVCSAAPGTGHFTMWGEVKLLLSDRSIGLWTASLLRSLHLKALLKSFERVGLYSPTSVFCRRHVVLCKRGHVFFRIWSPWRPWAVACVVIYTLPSQVKPSDYQPVADNWIDEDGWSTDYTL